MKILNRKARFNYKLFDKFEAGISLIGGEVKAIRRGHVDLSHSYAKIIDNEIYLINANIPIEGKKDYKPARTRKLLLHKKQIITISAKIKAKRLTLIPTKVYTRKRLVKVEVALAKTKRKFEKKQAIKNRDIEREIEAELKTK
jgi:SsrA-binding protein